MKTSLHHEAKEFAKANDWPWPFALGYASGYDDAAQGRKPEHSTQDRDDYAQGYCKGFKGLNESLEECDKAMKLSLGPQ